MIPSSCFGPRLIVIRGMDVWSIFRESTQQKMDGTSIPPIDFVI